MGTEVYSKSQVPGFYSMRDINEDSNSSGWSPFFRDNNLLNGQYYNGFMPRAVTDGYPEYEKNAVKQKMLEHEAIFKNQVCELHRVYRVQRDMMEEVGNKGLHKHRISIDTSSSSSHLPSQIPSDEAQNDYIPNFPLANSGYVRQPILGSEVTDSPLSCTKRNDSQAGYALYHNKWSSKDNGFSNSRPSKVRKKLFDLQLPADEYVDSEEVFPNSRISDFSSYPPNGDHRVTPENNINMFLRGEKTTFHKDTSSSSRLKSPHGLADLNEPIQVKENTPPICDDFRGRSACHGKIRELDLSSKPTTQDLTQEYSHNSHPRSSSEDLQKISLSNEGSRRGWLSYNYMYEAGNKGRNPHSIPKFLQSEQFPLSSHPIPFMRDKSHQHSSIFPTDRREESWIDKSHTYELTGGSRDSNYNHPDSIMASRISSSHVNSSDMANLWPQSATSWGHPNASLSQKLTSLSRHPHCISSETLSRTSQPSAQTHEIFGDKWHGNGSSRLTPGLGSDLPIRNGFYQGSPSGSKEKPVSRLPFYISSETLSRNSQPSSQTHEIFGDKWHANGSSRLSPGSAGDLPMGNGFYKGTTSGSKEILGHIPLIGKDSLNCSKLDMLGSECFSNSGSSYPNKNSDVIMDLKSGRDLDLNVVLPESSPDEADTQQHLDILGRKSMCDVRRATLPWLRKKPECKSAASVTRKDLNLVELGSPQASSNEFLKNETANKTNLLFAQNVTCASNGHNMVSKRESDESLDNKKILGYPVGKTYTSKNDSSSLVSTSASTKNEGYRGFDINVAYESVDADAGNEIHAEALVVEKGVDNTTFKILRNIDLNSCISEEEGLLGSSTSVRGKILLEIDLEALPSCDSEEEILHEEKHNQRYTPLQSPLHKAANLGDEVTRIAAEAIVAISSFGLDHQDCNYLNPSEDSLPDPLLWFAEVISSTPEDIESILYNRSKGRDRGETETCKELDDFEVMTLQLKGTREEDYMPTPFVPEFQEEEELRTTSLPGRPRRGQARRGRQKRDFQRDILPGLITLSRHEVAEDLQTFASLMRATGHQWNGLTRRNGTRSGATRGRKRRVVDPTPSVVVTPVCTPLMMQPNSVEVGLEDTCLTGWGQITRRPRRQRCAAGNNVVVA